MRLFKRSTIIRNVLLFILFSICHLHILRAIDSGVSAFSPKFFFNYLGIKWLIVLISFLAALAVFKAKQFSKYLLVMLFGLVIYESFIVFSQHFDKMILFMSFLYILLAFLFYVFWDLEIREAIYRPNFTKHNFTVSNLYPFKVFLVSSTYGEVEADMTNWDKASCFLVPKQSVHFNEEIVRVKIFFDGVEFLQTGIVSTQFENGVGIKFLPDVSQEISYNWNSFHQVIVDRGHEPGVYGI